MKLTFKKHEIKNRVQLQGLLSENAEAIEPGCRIIAASVNLGRSTVDLAGLDAQRTPILIGLGFTADDEMLFRMLEAYAWCLEYPESLRRLVPEGQMCWPPRVAFVAERMLEAFLRKIGLLRFPSVDCFEFRCVEVNGTTGFYLDPVEWNRSSPSSPREATVAPAARPAMPQEEPRLPEPPARAGAERREPAAGPVNGQKSAEEATQPRWLELMATPAENGDVKSAGGSDAWVARAEPAPVPAAAEPARGSVPDNLDRERAMLADLDLPANRELAPTWRKFLEKLTGGFDSRSTAPGEETATTAARDPESMTQSGTPLAASARDGAAPVEELGDRQRALFDGLKLPANGELAPQWRRFLDKPAIEESKIAAAKEYLHREFPLSTIYDFYEFHRTAHVFQLQDNHGKVSQLATIAAEFFESRRDAEIRAWFEKHKLAQAMRQAGQAGVLVTNGGVQVEKR